MNIKTLIPFAITLVAGAAIGYCLAPSSPAPAPEPEGKVVSRRPSADDDGERASNRALRARIRELESMLAKQGVEVEKREDEPRREGPSPRARDFRSEMERMMKENPERYAQMTNGMAQARQRRLDQVQSKIDFLSSVDTSKMSPEARKTHESLQDMIAKREELEDKMRGAMNMTGDERRAVFEEMRETDGAIRELNRAERENLLVTTAETLGFHGDEATEFVDTIKGIYRSTENAGRGGFGGFGGGRGGRGGRGPGGGRGGDR
jgi:hypothetical protein